MFDDLLMFHIVSTSIMVGVIWVIQLVHYPSFKYVKESDYIIFQKYHMSNISYIVFPVMFTELITALLIFFSGEKSLLNLIHNSGHPNLKFEKKVDFNKLFNEKFN